MNNGKTNKILTSKEKGTYHLNFKNGGHKNRLVLLELKKLHGASTQVRVQIQTLMSMSLIVCQ